MGNWFSVDGAIERV